MTPKGTCGTCGGTHKLTPGGRIVSHFDPSSPQHECRGSRVEPEPTELLRAVAVGTAELRGIIASVQIEDHPDYPGHVLVSLTIDPPSPGLDKVLYSLVKKIPAGQ